MTERELKKLRRADLLEMMLTLTQENEELRAQLEQSQRQLAERTISIENAGSLAEAALQLNGIFEAAQAACDQYTQNIRQRSENIDAFCTRAEQETREKCERMERETREKCDRMERETQEKCERTLAEAKLQADICWTEAIQNDPQPTDIDEDWLLRLPEE